MDKNDVIINEIESLKIQLKKSRKISLELLSKMKGCDIRVREKSVQLVEKTILTLLISKNSRWNNREEFILDLIKHINRKSYIKETQVILKVNEATAEVVVTTVLKELMRVWIGLKSCPSVKAN